MLVHEKNCSNPNTINEQLQLVVLFVLPQGDQFNYFFFELSPLPKRVGVVFFQKKNDAILQLFGILIPIFYKNYLRTPMFLTTSV